MKIASLIFAALFLAGVSTAEPTAPPSSDAHPYSIASDLDHAIHAGLHELYNYNFEKSLALFESIRSEEDKHPMVAFGVAATHWWRITSLVLESDPEESSLFLEAVENCIQISEAMIKQGDPTGEGHHVLGGAYGLLGRWQATNGQWLSAYRNGKRAYRTLIKALEINPELTDAYMGLGIFDYYVATLPRIVRNLAFIGMGGDPKVGIGELEKAAEHGTYAQTPSKLFLLQIYAEQLNEYEKALVLANELREEYPRSPFMHMMHIITLYNADNWVDLVREAASLEARVREKYYQEDHFPQAYFAQGLTHFKKQNWQEAAIYFKRGMESGDDKNPWKTWAGLYQGYCEDAMGNRDTAKTQYRWVLDRLRRWGSHDNAKARLSRPFKPDAPELTKLAL